MCIYIYYIYMHMYSDIKWIFALDPPRGLGSPSSQGRSFRGPGRSQVPGAIGGRRLPRFLRGPGAILKLSRNLGTLGLDTKDVCVYIYINTYIHPSIHPCMHACIHTHMCIHTCIRTYNMYMHAYIHRCTYNTHVAAKVHHQMGPNLGCVEVSRNWKMSPQLKPLLRKSFHNSCIVLSVHPIMFTSFRYTFVASDLILEHASVIKARLFVCENDTYQLPCKAKGAYSAQVGGAVRYFPSN